MFFVSVVIVSGMSIFYLTVKVSIAKSALIYAALYLVIALVGL